MKTDYQWRFLKTARLRQVALTTGEDLRHLRELDKSLWTALSLPVDSLRFDARTLDFLDTDHDGRIRAPELLDGVDWILAHITANEELFTSNDADRAELEQTMAALSDLDKAPPSPEDRAAEEAWKAAPGANPAILPLGDGTAEANDALAAVEAVIDDWFAVPDDLPLVTEEADRVLPLGHNLNPKFADAIARFVEKVLPVLRLEATPTELTRAQWQAIKGAFAPYRAWLTAKPLPAAAARAELQETEKRLRFKMNIVPFLRNFVNMAALYDPDDEPIFRTGTLYIDARACHLCFHVANEGAHAALAEKSECPLVYFKMTRKATGETRMGCAVITAGTTAALYAGRNGVFIDRDGADWDAVVTKVIEAPVSLRQAFWAPWKRLFETVSETARKFLAAKQDDAVANVSGTVSKAVAKPAAPAENPAAGGAALASSVAALGVGVGMAGAACAGLIGLVAGLPPWKVAVGLLFVICSVSLPNMILTWLKLRRRDIGAILNAGGWAVNRPLRFTRKFARRSTVC